MLESTLTHARNRTRRRPYARTPQAAQRAEVVDGRAHATSDSVRPRCSASLADPGGDRDCRRADGARGPDGGRYVDAAAGQPELGHVARAEPRVGDGG